MERGEVVDAFACAVFLVGLYGFVSLVLMDYDPTFIGDWYRPVLAAFATSYFATLGAVFPAVGGYQGLNAATYLLALVLSFAVINRGQPLRKDLRQTGIVLFLALFLFEAGLLVPLWFLPHVVGWDNSWVIQAFRGTPLQAFTNPDLLVLSGVALLANMLWDLWAV